MDGLRIDESMRHGLQQQQQQGGNAKEMLAKTPRRGLGLMINEAKTPITRSVPSSATRKISKATPAFEVFEDVEEVPKLEKKPAETNIIERSCSSPIEGVSRLPSSPHSPLFELENELELGEDVILTNETEELEKGEGDVEPLEDFNNISIDAGLIELGIEKWDEYPPIEIASRFDCLEDFRDDYADAEVISLYEDRPEHLEILPSESEIAKMMTREEFDSFVDAYFEEEAY
ncbi:unnamed protein product [Caenorhabditis angaria]|uniref:Uncharacterized protein n=1 Tax=Caenorhabditis angaria TaxID=860376 RepID=A0A9P1MTF8_9PELO|nr:unnamed protein product [Caenorhabditis angaria]